MSSKLNTEFRSLPGRSTTARQPWAASGYCTAQPREEHLRPQTKFCCSALIQNTPQCGRCQGCRTLPQATVKQHASQRICFLLLHVLQLIKKITFNSLEAFIFLSPSLNLSTIWFVYEKGSPVGNTAARVSTLLTYDLEEVWQPHSALGPLPNQFTGEKLNRKALCKP